MLLSASEDAFRSLCAGLALPIPESRMRRWAPRRLEDQWRLTGIADHLPRQVALVGVPVRHGDLGERPPAQVGRGVLEPHNARRRLGGDSPIWCRNRVATYRWLQPVRSTRSPIRARPPDSLIRLHIHATHGSGSGPESRSVSSDASTRAKRSAQVDSARRSESEPPRAGATSPMLITRQASSPAGRPSRRWAPSGTRSRCRRRGPQPPEGHRRREPRGSRLPAGWRRSTAPSALSWNPTTPATHSARTWCGR